MNRFFSLSLSNPAHAAKLISISSNAFTKLEHDNHCAVGSTKIEKE